MSDDVCTDDHSSGLGCPVHGYDESMPPPRGFRWHRVQRADGQVYVGMLPTDDFAASQAWDAWDWNECPQWDAFRVNPGQCGSATEALTRLVDAAVLRRVDDQVETLMRRNYESAARLAAGADSPERHIYRTAAVSAVANDPRPIHSLAPAQICQLAADAAVSADRERMAVMLRDRVLHANAPGLPAELKMKLDEFMFDLANDIEAGMKYHPRETSG